MLENLTELLLPALLLLAGAVGIAKKQDVYGGMLTGAQDGLRLMFSLIPTLILMLTAVTMLRRSGFFELLTPVFAPVFRLLGMPPEVAPLVLIRPLSGSAALAVGTDLMREYGVDSVIGRTAAVMLGSSETTFYTISVYFGAAGVKKTRYALPAALIADLNRVKFSLNPYNINRLTLKAGQAALEDTAYFEKTRAAIMDTRAWTMQQLTDRGFTVLDSRANFVFASTNRINGGVLYKELKKKGILVRHFDAPRIENWLRITIGTPEQMQALMDAVDKILEV